MILLASLTFYGFWRPEFLSVMLVSAVTDFFAAQRIESGVSDRCRRRWLLVSLFVNIGLLFYFKYLFFVVDNAVATLHVIGYDEIQVPALSIVLPLGISFYTFQTISYTVDVYRKLMAAEKDLVLYGCFVTFFPQLVAGPILRGSELLGQLAAKPRFKLDTFSNGIRRIVFGLFLKVVMADNIAPLVNFGFDQPVANLSALDVLTLGFLFGFQIYFDFSGYSHIAIGSAKLMGISFPENFDFPYMSASPRQFWRRWHISLSSWIRDYLYLPLLGHRVRATPLNGLEVEVINPTKNGLNPVLALLSTWTIMGFWHGANWTFVLWGFLQGSLVIIYRFVSPKLVRFPPILRIMGGWAITTPVIMLSWILFRADTVEVAVQMYIKLFSAKEWTYLGMRENTYLVTASIFISMIISYFIHECAREHFRKIQWAGLLIESVTMGLAASLVFIFLRPINQFIYFQF
jgi:D-alanyl-lipoteichoic acid acyltransferase DltB (MBOAT superfamily)